MRKFLINISGFSLVSLLVIVLLGIVGHQIPTNRYFTLIRQQNEFIKNHTRDISTLLLGSSHSQAIDFDSLGIDDGFYYWSPSEDIFETSYKINHLGAIDTVCCIILVFSPQSFLRNNSMIEGNYHKRIMFYNAYLSNFSYIRGEFHLFIRGKFADVVRPDQGKNIFKKFIGKKTPTPIKISLQNNYNAPKEFYETFSKDDVLDNIQHSLDNQIKSFSQIDMNSIVQQTTEEFSKIFEDLERRGVCSVVITPPYLSAYWEPMKSKLPKETFLFMPLTDENFEKMIYLDYSNSDDFKDAYDYFRDDHMNVNGAREFSNLIGSRVREHFNEKCGMNF